MIYILDQRLKAQSVNLSKSEKVVQDIVGQMFDPKCIKELFRPQRILSASAIKMIFTKLAHSSIMKLNEAAMDKLCDLMMMACKHQLLMCRRGEDIILVTLNHLDTIKKLVGDSDHHLGLVDSSIKTLTEHFGRLSASEFILLRSTLLSVFQDIHKRVSIFLKNGSQNSNGRFIIPTGGPIPNGFELPGTIRYYDGKGEVKNEAKFEVPFEYTLPEPPGSWALHGDRVITLGCNMFTLEKAPATSAPVNTSEKEKEETESPGNDITAEFQVLEKLLGSIRPPSASETSDSIKIIWFTDGEEDDTGKSEDKSKAEKNTLKIDPLKRDDALKKIAKDFMVTTPHNDSASNDLLDLLDSTNEC